MFLYRGFSLLQSEHPLFLHFPRLFFKIFCVKVEATTIEFYLEIPPKIGKKVGIHFYENILSEMNLPLIILAAHYKNIGPLGYFNNKRRGGKSIKNFLEVCF